ncbi:MAG: hypothetical protein AB7O82_37250, partial [Reyranella sp.]
MAACPIVALLVSPALGQSAPGWNLYTSSTSLVVPYTEGSLNSRNPNGTFSNHRANLDIKVADKTIGVTVDTGSTGVAIAQALLPAGVLNGLTSLGPGAYNYDSSGKTPTGNFYQLPIDILGTLNGQPAAGSSTIKVLVVTSDNSTAYFGIGNNRNNVYSGTYNPSLTFAQNVAAGNIVQIAPVGMNPLIDVAVNGTALANQGYVVMNDQLVVGLTTANNGYSFVKLTPDTAAGANLWNQAPVALSTGTSSPYVSGTILTDTGIPNAYVKPFVRYPTTLDVSLVGLPQQAGFYSFVVPESGSTCGTSTALTPCEVLGSTSDQPFINTGRQFFAGFNLLFDPTNGYVGYALSSSGLASGTDARIVPVLALTDQVPLPNGFATNLPAALLSTTTLTTNTGGTATFNASFTGYGNSLTVGGSGTVVFNGPIDMGSGGSFTVAGGGAATNNNMLTASGVSIASQGLLTNAGTIVSHVANAGTLINNGTIQGDVVNSGLLGGNSTIVGNLSNSGTLSPGNSIGTIAVTGKLVHVPAGAHIVEVNAQGQNDKIVVGGSAMVQGGMLTAQPLQGPLYAPRTTYTVVSATGGVTGTYSGATTNSPFLQPSLSYDANNVYHTLTVGGFAAATQTPTQAAVGAALDGGAPGATGDFATIL